MMEMNGDSFLYTISMFCKCFLKNTKNPTLNQLSSGVG